MSRTVTAMFDTRADAEAGRERLKAANIDISNVNIHDQTSSGYSDQSYSTAEHSNTGVWGSIKNAFIPDEDRHGYEEGIRRGSVVLSADVDEDEVDVAVRALEESDSIDIDDRMNSYRDSGWTAPAMGAGGMGATGMGAAAMPQLDRDTTRSTSGDEQVIPVVEERLVVGKREVERGGVRVRSYVTERPVHEQVRLREEHVNVERRPVDQGADSLQGDAFRERSIELTERSEEAVVGKEARVVEEVVVSKTANERTEDVSDTVRRTDVDVENIGTDTTRTSGTTGYGTAGTTGTGTSDTGLGRTVDNLADKAGNVASRVGDKLGLNDANRDGN